MSLKLVSWERSRRHIQRARNLAPARWTTFWVKKVRMLGTRVESFTPPMSTSRRCVLETKSRKVNSGRRWKTFGTDPGTIRASNLALILSMAWTLVISACRVPSHMWTSMAKSEFREVEVCMPSFWFCPRRFLDRLGPFSSRCHAGYALQNRMDGVLWSYVSEILELDCKNVGEFYRMVQRLDYL